MKFSELREAVVIDLETTGFDPKRDRMISIAMIRSDFSDLKGGIGKPEVETLDVMVNPQRSIPDSASRVNGITDRDVADMPIFDEIASNLRSFIGNRPIIAHNLTFDRRFLEAEFLRVNARSLAENRCFCTMRRFQQFAPGQKKSLESVAGWMGIEGRVGTIHGAVEDARIAWEIAVQFYKLDSGIRTTIAP